MSVKFELTEHVVMTDTGLLKECQRCHRCLPLEEFPKDDRREFLRQDDCKDCVKEIHASAYRGPGARLGTNAHE